MAPSKSKETKKEAMVKTNRRKGVKPPTKNSRASSAGPTSQKEGQKPEEVVDQMVKTLKNRPAMYEMLKAAAAHVADGFVKNIQNNPRMPVPINERRRVRVEKDEEYIPAQYCKMENSEYMVMQAPTKDVSRLFWRQIMTDNCRIIVALCHEDQMSATDDAKCFQYFPTEPNQSMDVEQKKGKLTIQCKSKEGMSMGAVKYEMEVTDSEVVIDPNSDDPNAANMPKGQQFTLFHMNTWTGTRPESGNPLEQAANLALFFRAVNMAEVNVLRKSMENFVPPVVLQSFDGVGRAAIAWVILMLLKDVEKRECFDVPDLIKKLMKMRAGSISCYYHYVLTMAIALNIGKELKWCENDCNNALNDLNTKFPDRKLNEVGNLLPP